MRRCDPWNVLVASLPAVLLFFVAILLTGCGLFEKKIEYTPFEVKVPIEVPCAAAVPPEPTWAGNEIKERVTPENIDVATDKLMAERKQRIGYEKKLKAAVEGCR